MLAAPLSSRRAPVRAFWALWLALFCSHCRAPSTVPSTAEATDDAMAAQLSVRETASLGLEPPVEPEEPAPPAEVTFDVQSFATTSSMWLHTHARSSASSNDPVAAGIYRADNSRWQGRGVVIHDTRGCDSCDWQKRYDTTETLRRIDLAVDVWHANVLRLVLESYSTADQGNQGTQRVNWQSLLQDANYLASVKAIVDYIGTKKGVYVQLSMWRDASFSNDGKLRPTLDSATSPGTKCDAMLAKGTLTTSCTWKKLAETFRTYPYVMYNIAGELAENSDGAQDVTIFNLLNGCVQTIRNVEDAAGSPHHIISVPGTRDWARSLAYYASVSSTGKATLHPITAGGGDNVAYQSHPYSSASAFKSLFLDASAYLPVIVGEFGPYLMTYSDMQTLINVADSGKLPYIAWSMHPNCGPATMLTEPGNQCDGSNASQIGTNTWGTWLKAKLATNLTDDPTYTSPSTPTTPTQPATPSIKNLALGKTTRQSTTMTGAPSNLAVDGNPSTLWSSGSIAHTTDRPGTTDPFWEVDLGDTKTLTTLIVLNRTDKFSERLQGALAFVSTQPFASSRVAPLLADATVTTVPIGRYLNGGQATASLANIKGRYVRIAMPGDGQILALAEVQVMGL